MKLDDLYSLSNEKLERIKELDLSGQTISEFPIIILKMKALKLLNLGF